MDIKTDIPENVARAFLQADEADTGFAGQLSELIDASREDVREFLDGLKLAVED